MVFYDLVLLFSFQSNVFPFLMMSLGSLHITARPSGVEGVLSLPNWNYNFSWVFNHNGAPQVIKSGPLVKVVGNA